MIRRSASAELLPWIERARASLVASFARGVMNDEAAVQAAITSPWSNGQTEGQITRLKLVKRQMYGRGKIDLLQARLAAAPYAGAESAVIGLPYTPPLFSNAQIIRAIVLARATATTLNGRRPSMPFNQGHTLS
jgi:hypothetical protein